MASSLLLLPALWYKSTERWGTPQVREEQMRNHSCCPSIGGWLVLIHMCCGSAKTLAERLPDKWTPHRCLCSTSGTNSWYGGVGLRAHCPRSNAESIFSYAEVYHVRRCAGGGMGTPLYRVCCLVRKLCCTRMIVGTRPSPGVDRRTQERTTQDETHDTPK